MPVLLLSIYFPILAVIDSPVLSSSLGTLLTDGDWNSEEASFSISELSFKYVSIQFKNKVVLSPLLHTVN